MDVAGSSDMFRRSTGRARIANFFVAGLAGLQSGVATASDAACGKVLGAGADFDPARGNCVAPNTLEVHCRQLPGYIEWQRTGRLGTCKFKVPGTGASRLPPTGPERTDLTIPAGCAEAKKNIDWVMRYDARAWRSYGSARRSTGPYDSLLYAQRHNRNAQLTIARCAGWAEAYARSLERGRPLNPTTPGSNAPPSEGWMAFAVAVDGTGIVVTSSGYPAIWQAERDVLSLCRARGARECQVVKIFSRGCSFIAGGRDARGRFVYGIGATLDAATGACSLQGAVQCFTPLGGCVGR